jgi:beta-glucanase (GH16 family)
MAKAAPPGSGWILTWSEEFDGTSIDTSVWNVENSTTSGYGGTLQAWTPQNVVVQDGVLRLISLKQSLNGMQYTSGAVNTPRKKSFGPYGWLEVRAKLPKGRGLWPAIWTNENNDPFAEIDLMEMLGHDPNRIHMTNHIWGTTYGHKEVLSCSYVGPDYSADFHTYAVDISPSSIIWYIDGVQRCGPSTTGVPTETSFILLNTSIGGSWPGSPDGSTVFPQYYDIDYVRFYTQNSSTDTTPPAAPQRLRVR